MIVAGGAIGYGPNPGDVLTGVGGGINISAIDEARILGKDMAEMVRKLKGNFKLQTAGGNATITGKMVRPADLPLIQLEP